MSRRTRARLFRHGPVILVALGLAAWLGCARSPPLAAYALGAFVVTWAIIPPLGAFLRRRRLVVHGGGRSAHRGAVPQMGGLAIFVPFAAVAVPLAIGGGTRIQGLLLGATLLLAVGLYDDLRGTSPRVKLAVQVLGALVLVAAGFRVVALDVPGFRTIELGHADIPLTIFWVVLATNAFNLIDGMDGIAAGVAVVALVGLVYLGVAAAMAAIVAGAVLGFLPHNLPRARIFLGDSGTMFLGFFISALILLLPSRANLPLAAGLFAYPVGDLALAATRRFVRGKPLSHGDTSHIHHKLQVHLGGKRRAVLMVWALAVICAALAIWMQNLKFLLLLVAGWAGLAYALVLLGRVRLGRMIGNRQPFQELHLARQYVEGLIRVARTQDEVRRALERLVEDLGLVQVEVGGMTVSAGESALSPGAQHVVRLPSGRATWALLVARPEEDEEEALRTERRAVIHAVLNFADRRLRQLAPSRRATNR